MAEVNSPPTLEKHVDKNNKVEPRSPSGSNGLESSGQNFPIRPPFTRADSRSTIPQQAIRPGGPQIQQRPQFQPGVPVPSPTNLGPRVGSPVQRVPTPAGPSASPQFRNQPPVIRPLNQPPLSSQQGVRLPQSPASTQPTQRSPVPNSLQFGPRQAPQFITTPNGTSKANIVQNISHLPRQPSQSSLTALDSPTSTQKKLVNLENQVSANENSNNAKTENSNEMPGATKGRSFSISAASGAPSLLKDDDRRKSISAAGSRYDDLGSRSPGLGLIQEMRGSKDNNLGSKESVKSEKSTDGKDITERPESRLAGSKMTESFMGSFSNLASKKKIDDDDVVVSQNNLTSAKNETSNNKTDISDRSPSLTRSDDSPEPKNVSSMSNKPQLITAPEPQRSMPKSDTKQEIKSDINKDIKPIATSPKIITKSPTSEIKTPNDKNCNNKKPTELKTSPILSDSKHPIPRKIASAPGSRPKDGDNDSGVDESTQGNDINGTPASPNKKLPSKLPTKEKSSSSLRQTLSRSSSKSATAKTPETPQPVDKKKVPMNKVQVGNAPSPNIKAVKSKIGSFENTTYKPGGGKVKIENRKLDFNNVTPKIAAKNEAYSPSGGVKKITTTKLEWNAKSKIGSLQNASYKPGGGDKKIETVKLDFKEKAKPKVASTANITHKPGGGAIKNLTLVGTRTIENQKLEFKAQSKVGSLDNVKHKPGGGDIKIFDDKDYVKQIGGQSPQPNSLGQSRQEDIYASIQEWSEESRPLTRSRSARWPPRPPRTPRAAPTPPPARRPSLAAQSRPAFSVY